MLFLQCRCTSNLLLPKWALILLPRDPRLYTVKALKQLQISNPPRDTARRQAGGQSGSKQIHLSAQTPDQTWPSHAVQRLSKPITCLRAAPQWAVLRSVASTAITVQLQIDGELLAIMRRRSKKQRVVLARWLPPATQLSLRGELIDATAARRCPTWT